MSFQSRDEIIELLEYLYEYRKQNQLNENNKFYDSSKCFTLH